MRRQTRRQDWMTEDRQTAVSASMTGRDNLIIIWMWDVMNYSHWLGTHTHIPKTSSPKTTQPKVSTSALITWNNTLPCVHSSVPWRLMHCRRAAVDCSAQAPITFSFVQEASRATQITPQPAGRVPPTVETLSHLTSRC